MNTAIVHLHAALMAAGIAALFIVQNGAANAQDAPAIATVGDATAGNGETSQSTTAARGASAGASDWTGGASLDTAGTLQILPVSPVAGGNDPNASDDVLYVLEENNEDAARRTRLGRKAHFFVNPMGRVAASATLSPALTVDAFATSSLAAFDKQNVGFGTRTSSLSGGLNANGNLQIVNLALAYEHRDSHIEFFGPHAAESDKVGITVNKTYPLFVQNLRFTPQVLAADETVAPYKSSSANIEATAGLTYDPSPRLSFAASAGYQTVFLYGVPGYRHNDGLKLILGATLKVTDRFTVVAGATTMRTILYGLPTYRADGSISPALTAKYQILPGLTASVVTNYGRFISTATGQGTFKYNINPSIALTVPL